MDEREKHINDARKAFERLETAADYFTVTWEKDRLRRALGEAKADAAVLDPAGKRTAAEMEADIAIRLKAAWLKAGRDGYQKFIAADRGGDKMDLERDVEKIMECLGEAEKGLAALDETGASSGEDIKDAIAMAVRRRSLFEARHRYGEWIAANVPGWGDSADWHEKRISQALELAGEEYEALDPSGKTSAAEARAKIAEATARMQLLCAREKMQRLEATTSAAFSDDHKRQSREIRQLLETSGNSLAALDETGRSTDADIEARLAKAETRLLILGAQETWKFMQDDLTRDTFLTDYRLAKLRNFLEAAGVNASVLDPRGKATAAEMEAEIEGVTAKLYLKDLKSDLKNAASQPAVRSFDALVAFAEKLKLKFNAASRQIDAECETDPDARRKLDEGIDAAIENARRKYYDAGGKMPVLKPLKLAPRTGNQS